MQNTQTQVAHTTQVQVAHPERVAWYSSLIQEWTGKMPRVAVQDGQVAAWVTAYSSQAGMYHPPTQVWEASVEDALETLAAHVYADLQADLVALSVQAVSALVRV